MASANYSDITGRVIGHWSGGGGGGSSPFKDLGNVTAVELVANGPKTIYTPAGGEFIFVYFKASVDLDNGQIDVEPYNAASKATGGAGIFFAQDASVSQDLLWAAGHGDTVSGLYFPATPVKLVWEGAANPLLGPAGTWQAGHAYNVGDGIIDGADHVQIVTVAGTSGGSLPTFDDSLGTTPDGGVTWQDNNPQPAAGSLHVVALTGVPA